MNFEITNKDNYINIKVEFDVDTWDDLKKIMEILDDEVGAF